MAQLVYEWVTFSWKIGICMGLLSNLTAARPYQNQTWVPPVPPPPACTGIDVLESSSVLFLFVYCLKRFFFNMTMTHDQNIEDLYVFVDQLLFWSTFGKFANKNTLGVYFFVNGGSTWRNIRHFVSQWKLDPSMLVPPVWRTKWQNRPFLVNFFKFFLQKFCPIYCHNAL